jgi:NAD(P)-dependent dehydrogenase (short-subunit alcohol dehydrogenase family)
MQPLAQDAGANITPTSRTRLEGKVILVTGAGRGLGHGVARGLASYGATVLGVARSDDELAELASVVRQSGGTIETYAVDLGSSNALDRLTRDILARHGRVDAVVNNAAILRLIPFVDLDPKDFDETIAVNLLAPVRLIRAFLPAMLEQERGAIINVSSNAGVKPYAAETDYCATKYGLEGFSYSLAMELAPRNISVNVVSPGYAIKPTSVTAAEFAAWPAERRERYRDPIAMADAFAYLALQEPAEGGITGQRFDAYKLAEEVRQRGWDGGWRPASAQLEGVPA